MNILIVYFSKFGNTRKVAETVGQKLGPAGCVRVISSDQLTASDLAQANLVVMGSPTHRMNLPEAVRPVFDSLPRRVLRDTWIAAFDTSYKMSWWLAYFTAGRRLAKKLRKFGGKQIAPPETFHVVGKEGPLYDGELERARLWAESILVQLAAQGV
jgi:flavodoxin